MELRDAKSVIWRKKKEVRDWRGWVSLEEGGGGRAIGKGMSMSDIERRVLLGALGVGAMAALAKAGPITPPSGAIAPSGRTLDEIFNKVPAVGGADGRIPIAGGTSTVTINQPGSYVLTGNIAVSGGSNAVAINASNVTLDLNGFRISQSTANGGNPIAITLGGATNVVIRNGSTSGGGVGIGMSNNIVGVLIEDLDVYNAKILGIGLATGVVGCVIRRCRVFDTGSSTTAADGNLPIRGIDTFTAIGTRVENCTVSRLFYNGTGIGTLTGINMGGSANTVERCMVFDDGPITGSGILATGSVYRNNTVTNFSVKYFGGTDGGGNF